MLAKPKLAPLGCLRLTARSFRESSRLMFFDMKLEGAWNGNSLRTRTLFNRYKVEAPTPIVLLSGKSLQRIVWRRNIVKKGKSWGSSIDPLKQDLKSESCYALYAGDMLQLLFCEKSYEKVENGSTHMLISYVYILHSFLSPLLSPF